MKKKSREIESKMSAMPKCCDECGALFDKNDKASLNKWRIAVYDEGPINLVCPDCVPDDVQ